MRLRSWLPALPLLFLVAGRFVPGPAGWGFNHFAWLPVPLFVAWAILAASILLPGVRRPLSAAMAGPAHDLLFRSRGGPWLAGLAFGVLFALLRERSYFMGDGYLVGELIDRGMPFRAFDSLDYLLHFQVHQAFKALGRPVDSFLIYRVGAILAGVCAVVIWTRLIARLPWEPWRRTALLGLLLFTGPVALFFGYVESYSFLYLFITAYLLTGLLALESRVRLWVPALWFGLGLSFHLTAIFSAPALVVLALRARSASGARRWLSLALPPALLFLLAVLLHVAEGYDATWFRREFVEAKNTKHLWVSLGGAYGLFSLHHWKDLANLLLITAPVSLAIAIGEAGAWRRRWREPAFLFLLAQIASTAFFSIALDRKLGGARDWDLLAAHTAGLVLLSVLALPGSPRPAAGDPGLAAERRRDVPQDRGGPADRRRKPGEGLRAGEGNRAAQDSAVPPVAALAVGAAFLMTVPWIVLLHLEERSIARFVAVAADFPDFQRAYAYEEVGKYYRKAATERGDDAAAGPLMSRAQELYERAVEANPSHARLRVLLGSIYYSQDQEERAEFQYREALRLDPKNFMAMEMLGRLAIRREAWEEAYGHFQQLIVLRPDQATAWELSGYAAARAGRYAEALNGLGRAMALNPSLNYHHEIGVSLMRLDRPAEAVEAFRQACSRPDPAPESRIGLAVAIAATIEAGLAEGIPAPAGQIDEAERQIQEVLARQPGSTQALQLQEKLRHLRR